MSGKKRSFEKDDESHSLHPSRRRRLEHGEDSAQIAAILNDLADNLPTVRQEASRKLLISLTERPQLLEYALTRLIKGLCSDRKAARLGFSTTLVEVLRLDRTQTKFSSLRPLVDQVLLLTRPEANANGQERRGCFLGQRFAYHAILLSEILPQASEDEVRYLFDALAELAAEKQWLRNECLAILHDYIGQPSRGSLTDQHARHLIDSWKTKGLLKTPEGVALWYSVRAAFPRVKLPKEIWRHDDPMHAQNRSHLTKVMLEDAAGSDDEDRNMSIKKGGARPLTPSLAWSIIMNFLYIGENKTELSSFWSDCVAASMFSPSSSSERKALGLQLLSQALQSTPCGMLDDIIHPNIVRCILDQRAKPDSSLFESAKAALNDMASRGKRQPDAAPVIVIKMMTIVTGSLDSLTQKTLEALLNVSKSDGLNKAISKFLDLCWEPGLEKDARQAENKRRVLANLLLICVRGRKAEPSQLFVENSDKKLSLSPWLHTTLEGLVNLGYTAEQSAAPTMSESSRLLFRERLTSCLSDLIDRPLEQAIIAPSTVVAALHSSRKSLVIELDAEARQAMKRAHKFKQEIAEKSRAGVGDGAIATADRASQLLLVLSMLEVYKQEPGSLSVLEDLISYLRREGKDSSTELVELLLSFVSKESGLFRTMGEQVFSAFAPDVTREGLQSMIDILQQKEGLSGQQELFNQHDDAAEDDDEEDGDVEEEGIDVEDDSDLELVNGEVMQSNGRSDEDEDAESASSSDDTSSADSNPDDGDDDEDLAEEDEETAFDRKLADALGTAGLENDSDDGSDMDDDQMMALDQHLTNIFKERKTDKKQEKKDAKQNVLHFKSRVLDLLKKYVKSQYANPITVDLIVPLISLVRTTSNKALAEKAFNDVLKPYFDTCSKTKSFPELEEAGSLEKTDLLGLLRNVHDEVELGGSKMHASACSRASLFISRVLVASDPASFEKVNYLYMELQNKWYLEPRSKIHASVFTDWISWMKSTKKHA